MAQVAWADRWLSGGGGGGVRTRAHARRSTIPENRTRVCNVHNSIVLAVQLQSPQKSDAVGLLMNSPHPTKLLVSWPDWQTDWLYLIDWLSAVPITTARSQPPSPRWQHVTKVLSAATIVESFLCAPLIKHSLIVPCDQKVNALCFHGRCTKLLLMCTRPPPLD